ncbi:PadR family transcriptional regulator [Roseivirga misakiensis]|uniref:PadR family transcriptional regulator n=1 Tax=Roseivirga misakiensis TaxID=1563681 RepID=A0A1E5T0R3_9BACT|nr:helix-turn-helix transcriptional regulator [Roseivirga misakiensis]OEK04973.1 PadR family transcriptional regulator [Roseivirga misakiensis]
MRRTQLGEFEEVVMLAVGILCESAYGVSIKTEIEKRTGRGVSVGALQSALKRLEEKGFLRSREGEGTAERAGRPKKYFSITMEGKKALETARDMRNNMWNDIPGIAFDLKLIFS